MKILEFDNFVFVSFGTATRLVHFSPMFFELVRTILAEKVLYNANYTLLLVQLQALYPIIVYGNVFSVHNSHGKCQGILGWPGHQVWIHGVSISFCLGFWVYFL